MLVARTSIFHCRARKARIPSLIDPNDLPTNHVALKKTSVDFNHQAVASSEQHKEVSLSLADEIAHICPVQSNPQALVRLLNEGKTRCYGLIIDALAESPSTMDKFIDVFFSRMRKVVDHLQKVMQTFFGRGQEERRRSWCEGQWELSQKKKLGKDRVPGGESFCFG